MSATIVATHFTDPGCPWGYSARPAHARLQWRFGDQIEWRLVMIGLTERAEQYAERGYTPAGMSSAMQTFQERWGMPFAFPVKARVAGTSRACRAVVAARLQDEALAEPALRALQVMHFTTPGLLDEDDDLRGALARVDGLDADAIVARLDAPDVVAAYEADRAQARQAEGSPTHAQGRTASTDGPIRYTAPTVIFEHVDGGRLEVGGFQPFEAYDTALSNLDPALDRRPAPDSPAEVLAAFPDGLTTAEVAAILRPSELDEPDLWGTREQLAALTADGDARCDLAGGDALWRPAAHDRAVARLQAA